MAHPETRLCPAAKPEPCHAGCPGWGWFNPEIQRCDECRLYPNDAEARRHVKACEICEAHLKRYQRLGPCCTHCGQRHDDNGACPARGS